MKILKEEGRQTGSGAFTESKVFDPAGNKIMPYRESSKTGNHWTDTFKLEENIIYLVLVMDYSNSGKDNSNARIEGGGDLSEVQKELKKKFEEEHRR